MQQLEFSLQSVLKQTLNKGKDIQTGSAVLAVPFVCYASTEKWHRFALHSEAAEA